MTVEDEIKSALARNAILVGTRSAARALKEGRARLVVLASNAPEDVRKDFDHYSRLSGTKVEMFNGTGKQLGVFLGKPFPVASLAIMPGHKTSPKATGA